MDGSICSFLTPVRGFGKNKAADYAMILNRDVQEQAVNPTLPSMPERGHISFVTGHLAHFHGEKPNLPGYEPVAASKKAGEDALRRRNSDFTRGTDLIVVSGDLLRMITPKLSERNIPGLIKTRRFQAGSLPSSRDFAEAIVEAAYRNDLPSGTTLLVGETD